MTTENQSQPLIPKNPQGPYQKLWQEVIAEETSPSLPPPVRGEEWTRQDCSVCCGGKVLFVCWNTGSAIAAIDAHNATFAQPDTKALEELPRDYSTSGEVAAENNTIVCVYGIMLSIATSSQSKELIAVLSKVNAQELVNLLISAHGLTNAYASDRGSSPAVGVSSPDSYECPACKGALTHYELHHQTRCWHCDELLPSSAALPVKEKGTMKFKQIIGAVLIALPFIGVLIYGVLILGWLDFGLCFSLTILIVVAIIGGVHLLFPKR